MIPKTPRWTLAILILLCIGPLSLVVKADDIERLRPGVGNNYPMSQVRLAETLYFGEGVPQDFKQALFWYRKAAELGIGIAQLNVGLMYGMGKGIRTDQKKAVSWITLAADSGNNKANIWLAKMYYQGQWVPKDDSKAEHYFSRAGRKPSAEAQYAIGMMHRSGEGLPQDFDVAAKWFHKASKLGSAEASKALEELYYSGLVNRPDTGEKGGMDVEAFEADMEEAQNRLENGECDNVHECLPDKYKSRSSIGDRDRDRDSTSKCGEITSDEWRSASEADKNCQASKLADEVRAGGANISDSDMRALIDTQVELDGY